MGKLHCKALDYGRFERFRKWNCIYIQDVELVKKYANKIFEASRS